jgi:MFS family permease
VSALDCAAPSSVQAAAPRLNRPFVAVLMIANFGSNVALIAPIQNILPRMIESSANPSDKALWLGVVTGIGALAALVFNPLAGHYSDRWVSTDNRAWIIVFGLVTGGIAHLVLGLQHSIVGIVIWWTLCQATINIAYGPMTAIVVDHVDKRFWGLVWGLVSVAQAVGLVIGLAAVVLLFPSVAGGMTAISVGYVVCLIPLVLVLLRLPRISYEVPDGTAAGGTAAGGTAAGGTAASGRGVDWRALLAAEQGFGAVFAGRFLIMLAETIALLYLYYYLQDVVHYRDPGEGQLILILVATVAVVIATVVTGRLADQSGGYRRYAVVASVLMAATGFLLAGFAVWGLVLVCAFTLGAGYGAFQSVSQALSLVVLPSPANAGRDLGIINIAAAVPQVIGAPIAGLVVAELGGYRGLFVFAALLALAAAAVFTRVPSQRLAPASAPTPPNPRKQPLPMITKDY